jgi:hypothetical protein
MAHRLFCSLLLTAALATPDYAAADEPFVPGTGVKVKQVGYFFVDPLWG